MKHLFLCALCSLLPMVSWGQVGGLERSIPEKEGVPSEKIIALFDSLMAFPDTEIHSVMVLRNGKVIAEMYPAPFRPEYGHQLFSCSKTNHTQIFSPVLPPSDDANSFQSNSSQKYASSYPLQNRKSSSINPGLLYPPAK